LINLVSGGAGFIGRHLIEKLLNLNERVICIDNFSSGSKVNAERWGSNPHFDLLEHDITEYIDLKIDRIWHLACPASPYHYQKQPILTSKINFLGTYNLLKLANKYNARFLFTSSSEIYGDSGNEEQNENFYGYLNPVGKRSCYGEGKRIAESLCFDFYRHNNTDIRVARLFNVYGPNMSRNDGRVISNFICQALQGKEINIYGDGSQTRSFCYISDIISGLLKLMNSSYIDPINLGNPYQEICIKNLAKLIINKIDPSLDLKFKFSSLPEGDPKMRKPNILNAKKFINWEPLINLNSGLEYTINYFKNVFK